jgi:hypothetical protein
MAGAISSFGLTGLTCAQFRRFHFGQRVVDKPACVNLATGKIFQPITQAQ